MGLTWVDVEVTLEWTILEARCHSIPSFKRASDGQAFEKRSTCLLELGYPGHSSGGSAGMGEDREFGPVVAHVGSAVSSFVGWLDLLRRVS